MSNQKSDGMGEFIITIVSAWLLALGFYHIDWAWPFGALVGFFGSAFLIKVLDK